MAEPVNAAPHVVTTGREPHAHARRHQNHRFHITSSTRLKARPSKLDPTRTRQSPPTSISIVSETAGTGVSSGSGVIVTGTSPLDDCDYAGKPDGSASRRQRKTWFALTSYCRATIETDDPGR